MRKFLTVLFTLFFVTNVFANNFANDINKSTNVLENRISHVYVTAPCRILYKVADTTHIRVSNDFITNGLYFELNDSTLIIKSKYPINDFNLGDTGKLPTVCILMKDTLPKIKASSSFTITSKNTLRNRNETTINTKQ
jgi:hypothetical protein